MTKNEIINQLHNDPQLLEIFLIVLEVVAENRQKMEKEKEKAKVRAKAKR